MRGGAGGAPARCAALLAALALAVGCGEAAPDAVASYRPLRWELADAARDAGREATRAPAPSAPRDAASGAAPDPALDPAPDALAPAPRALADDAGEARRAQVLTASAPLRARVVAVPPGARLALALGRPQQALPPALDLEVELRTRQAGADWTGRRVLLPVSRGDAPRWHARELPLDAPAGAALELELRLLQARDGERVLVAESALLAPGRRGPRVLLVTSDTHRADHLAAALAAAAPDGAQPATPDELHDPPPADASPPPAPPFAPPDTPHLNALAARGVLFADCFAPTNVTNPSHMSLFTGVHPRDLGIDDNTRPLGPRADTLAERFAAAGFRTLAVVSARHLGHPESGLGQGFERMAWPLPEGEHPAPHSVARLVRWLDDAGPEPLFVWLHLFDAHRPYRAPAHWRERYWPPGRDPADPTLPPLDVPASVLPEKYRDVRDLDYLRALYKAEVSFLDGELGALLGHPALADAAVAVTADHGESLGAHGIHFGHAGLFPDTLHVPLLLAWPGGPAGRVVRAPVSHADLGATLAALAGSNPRPWPGRDLRELVAAPPGGGPPRFALSAHGFSAALTHAGWHLVLQLRTEQQPVMSERFEKHAVRLHHLPSDPRCERDLAAAEPERARALRARLIAWLQDARPLDLAGSASEDREQLARLAALGYVATGSDPDAPLWIPDACAHCERWE